MKKIFANAILVVDTNHVSINSSSIYSDKSTPNDRHNKGVMCVMCYCTRT